MSPIPESSALDADDDDDGEDAYQIKCFLQQLEEQPILEDVGSKVTLLFRRPVGYDCGQKKTLYFELASKTYSLDRTRTIRLIAGYNRNGSLD